MSDRTPMQRALDRDTQVEDLARENERLREALPAGDEPAFPYAERNDDGSHFRSHTGMSLRAYIATAAMQGLLASGPHDCDQHGIAHDAILHADALIAALKGKE